jgi:PAS domain-containing protein
VSASRAPRVSRIRSAWPPPARLLRYGLAVLSVGLAVLLMQGLRLLAADDARPALLVAVAVSALYGGIGPGVLALTLATFVAQDPVVLLAGALLAAVCASFRRPQSIPQPPRLPVGDEETVPGRDRNRFNRLDIASERFSNEVTRSTPPPFIEVTTEATWRFHHEQPLDITIPEDEQVEHLYLFSVLAECNDAFARMYGFRAAGDVVGTRLVVFLPPSNPENVAYLRTFIRSGYRLEDAESHEIDRYGNAKYFVNNLVGIFERGQLVGAWGTQRDVTATKAGPHPQEYRSRIHSTKSSSQ